MNRRPLASATRNRGRRRRPQLGRSYAQLNAEGADLLACSFCLSPRKHPGKQLCERTTGFEPATSTLARWCSSQLSYVRMLRKLVYSSPNRFRFSRRTPAFQRRKTLLDVSWFVQSGEIRTSARGVASRCASSQVAPERTGEGERRRRAGAESVVRNDDGGVGRAERRRRSWPCGTTTTAPARFDCPRHFDHLPHRGAAAGDR